MNEELIFLRQYYKAAQKIMAANGCVELVQKLIKQDSYSVVYAVGFCDGFNFASKLFNQQILPSIN